MTQFATRPKTNTASRRARAKLLEQIGEHWHAGDQLPPVRELAQQLGIAPGTAHRALNMLVDDGLLDARPRQGVFVSDRIELRPFQADSSDDMPTQGNALVGKRIALVSVGLNVDGFVPRMVNVTANAVKSQKGQVINIRRRTLEGEDCWDLGEIDSDALVLYNLTAHRNVKLPTDRPTVLISTGIPYPPDKVDHCDIVTVDQEQGGVLAGRALREAGGKHACFIGKGDALDGHLDPTSAARLHGFEHAFAGDRVTTVRAPWYGLIAGGHAACDFMKLKDRPDCVFAASDELAVGFINGVAAHGLRVGRDYQIVGFDGQDVARNLDGGALATIEVPAPQMAQHAGELLAKRFQFPRLPMQRVLLGCSFLAGETVHSSSTHLEKRGSV